MPKHLITFLVCLMIVPTTSAAWQSPETVEGATTINTQIAKAYHDQNIVFIDVRSLRLFANRHIPGAHHLDIKTDFTEANLKKLIDKDQPAAIYCNGSHCSLSYKSVTKAVEWGFTNILYYRDGMKAWRKNHPIESSALAQ